MKRLSTIAVAISSLAFTQCLAPENGLNKQLVVVTSLAQDLALRHYQNFAEQSAVLAASTLTLCETPTATSLADAQVAWRRAKRPWKRAQVIGFGPVAESSLQLGPKIDSWPVNEGALEELIEADADLDFEVQAPGTRGLPVVEYLLFGDDALQQLTTPGRCATLVGAAADVAQNATRLRDEWRTVWLPFLSEPGVGESPYENSQAVVDEWVNHVAFTTENIRLEKLGQPLGTGGQPVFTAIESRHSQHSLVDAGDALQGAADVWNGAGNLGLRDLVRDVTITNDVDRAFDTAIAAVQSIPSPLETAIVSDRDQVEAAMDALLLLQIVVEDHLAGALDATLDFNDADGD